jgi:hypothetical protein
MQLLPPKKACSLIPLADYLSDRHSLFRLLKWKVANRTLCDLRRQRGRRFNAFLSKFPPLLMVHSGCGSIAR